MSNVIVKYFIYSIRQLEFQVVNITWREFRHHAHWYSLKYGISANTEVLYIFKLTGFILII